MGFMAAPGAVCSAATGCERGSGHNRRCPTSESARAQFDQSDLALNLCVPDCANNVHSTSHASRSKQPTRSRLRRGARREGEQQRPPALSTAVERWTLSGAGAAAPRSLPRARLSAAVKTLTPSRFDARPPTGKWRSRALRCEPAPHTPFLPNAACACLADTRSLMRVPESRRRRRRPRLCVLATFL